MRLAQDDKMIHTLAPDRPDQPFGNAILPRRGRCDSDLTAFLYQRDGEIIAFARPDLAVSGTGSTRGVPVHLDEPVRTAGLEPARGMACPYSKLRKPKKFWSFSGIRSFE
jgi:hypothetical protein